MISIYWAVFLWLLVFVLVPPKRIRQLWSVPIISSAFVLAVDYTLIRVDYYRFKGELILIGGVPIFYLLGVAAAGILLVNWMQKGLYNKVLIVTVSSLLLLLSEYVFVVLGAFQHLESWSFAYSFFLNLFGISVLSWLLLAAVGRDRIYSGNELRFLKKSLP